MICILKLVAEGFEFQDGAVSRKHLLKILKQKGFPQKNPHAGMLGVTQTLAQSNSVANSMKSSIKIPLFFSWALGVPNFKKTTNPNLDSSYGLLKETDTTRFEKKIVLKLFGKWMTMHAMLIKMIIPPRCGKFFWVKVCQTFEFGAIKQPFFFPNGFYISRLLVSEEIGNRSKLLMEMGGKATNAMPIISKIFCSSSQVVLVVRMRPRVINGGGFVVTDCAQKVVFKVEGCAGLGAKGELIVRDGDGGALLLIRRKVCSRLPYKL